MDENFYALCRFCLIKSEFKYSLFMQNIQEKIEFLALTQVMEDDELPASCCETCLTKINSFHKFKKNIIESEKVLRDQLATIESEPKVLEIVQDAPHLFEVFHMDEVETKTEPLEVYTDEKFDISCDGSNKESNPDIESNLSDEDQSDAFTDLMNKQNSTMTCEKCNKRFTVRRVYLRHMQGHKVEKCPVCSLVLRRDNLKKHIDLHDSSHEVCDVCGKIAKNKESLRGHIYYSHRNINKHIKCEYCDKEFKHNNHHQAHVRNVHLGLRDQQCHVCGKKFNNGYALKKHISMTHQGARPHICDYCKKGFCSLYALKTHRRQHTHETPFPCEYCPQAFRQKVSLNTHLKSKHSVVVSKKDEKNVDLIIKVVEKHIE